LAVPKTRKEGSGIFPAKKLEIGKVRVRIKMYLSKPVWTFAFQIWRAFSSCEPLLFLSFSEAEVSPDLVLLFLLSSACTFLLLMKEKGAFPFREAFLLRVQLSRKGFL
jgi:hypothetical protein